MGAPRNELRGRGKHNYLGVGGIAQNRCDRKLSIEGGMAGKHNYLGGRRVAQIHVVSYWLTGGGELEGELAGMGNFKLPKHIINELHRGACNYSDLTANQIIKELSMINYRWQCHKSYAKLKTHQAKQPELDKHRKRGGCAQVAAAGIASRV